MNHSDQPVRQFSTEELLAPGGKVILEGAIAVLNADDITEGHKVIERIACAFRLPFGDIQSAIANHNITLPTPPPAPEAAPKGAWDIG